MIIYSILERFSVSRLQQMQLFLISRDTRYISITIAQCAMPVQSLFLCNVRKIRMRTKHSRYKSILAIQLARKHFSPLSLSLSFAVWSRAFDSAINSE